MKKLLQILVIHSIKDLFKYKSFFLLIFILIAADRIIKRFVDVDRSALELSRLKQWGDHIAPYVFGELPGKLLGMLLDYRTFLVLIGLFFFKQIISLWPSSDMRRMHRQERGTFGLIGSLITLRWQQVLWDALAVSSICAITVVWGLASFGICRYLWQIEATYVWLVLWGWLVVMGLPVTMAGFSYSSKLAVIHAGGFLEKLRLFFKLFSDGQILLPSWIFFLCRITLETLFVVMIPTLVLILMDNFYLRILLASLIATPVYSYLKMASFKFFLEVYGKFPIVRAEYAAYYETKDNGSLPENP
ncbi:hypothetical protein ACFL9U_06920 [Thermodesulfobacteriota bacterium]